MYNVEIQPKNMRQLLKLRRYSICDGYFALIVPELTYIILARIFDIFIVKKSAFNFF